jgi:hypothetical protein
MRAAGLGVHSCSALRAKTVYYRCAFRSLPYPENLFRDGKHRVSHRSWKPKRNGSLKFLASHPPKSSALGLQLDTGILTKHIA